MTSFNLSKKTLGLIAIVVIALGLAGTAWAAVSGPPKPPRPPADMKVPSHVTLPDAGVKEVTKPGEDDTHVSAIAETARCTGSFRPSRGAT